MDINKLNESVEKLAEIKTKLSTLDYNDPTYELLEDELHDLEDDFNEQYGDFLEDALHEVHDEFCPDNDVLLATAYLADKYIEVKGKLSDVENTQGVLVEADDFPNQAVRITLAPNPLRIILTAGQDYKENVWVAKERVA
ncbi:MAG: hypothetical protein LAT68_04640 [Cyclobacteriaceae bacterium]|nr:hypothetical protein [Cyclobacteriaceae bacterium]MCH8515598.1 hypothetical protein [Cyclobacteriaceae bacterium]